MALGQLVLDVVVTDTRPGAWCDRCLLPSAVDVDAVLVVRSTLRRIGTVQAVTCPDCGLTQ